MSEISKVFFNEYQRDNAVLIAYVTAGDPNPEDTVDIAGALVKGGADIIELGIPFSDPIADGPTIQAATVRALNAGTTVKKVLKIARTIKNKWKIPVVLLTYYNPIFKMGLKNFFEYAQISRTDGVIVPDLPIEESTEYSFLAKNYKIDTIFLASPSTSKERLIEIANASSGFLYLVSVFGVTGTREKMQDNTIKLIQKAAQIIVKRKIPLAVGFGISNSEQVKMVIKNGADAVIVGSRFVKIIENKHEKKEQMLIALEESAFNLKQATTKERMHLNRF